MSTPLFTPGKCTALAVLGGVGLTVVASTLSGGAAVVATGGILTWLAGVAGNQVHSWLGSKIKNPPPNADDVFRNHHIRQLLSQGLIATVGKLIPVAKEKLGGVSQTLIDSGEILARHLEVLIDSPSGTLAVVREFNVTSILTECANRQGEGELLRPDDWQQFIDEVPELKDLRPEEHEMLVSELHEKFGEALWGLVKHDAATDRQAFAAVELLYLSRILDAVQSTSGAGSQPDLSPIITRIGQLLADIDQKHVAYFQSILGGISALAGKFEVFFDTYGKHRAQDEEFQDKITASLRALTSPPAQFEFLKQRYLRRLVDAFSTYEDLETSAISTADGKERITRITDIFVPPACGTDRCEADTFDRLHAEGKHPNAAVLPLLAQEENRRTVILADPGYGKSTLLQWLIVTLAEGKSPENAAELKGCIPLPIIVRDVVRHLPDDLKAWASWDEILNAFRQVRPPLSKSQTPLLGDFAGGAYEAEFCTLIRDTHAYFIIDGLDEIGDREKRTAFRNAIWEGMRTLSGARWLITSRVIGYELAEVDVDEFKGRHSTDVPSWQLDLSEDVVLASAWSCLPNAPVESNAELEADEVVHTIRINVATRLYLAPFDDTRQRKYAHKWFEQRTGVKDDDRAVKLIEEAHRHDAVRVISRVPSILCLMAILKRKGLPLPDGRAELYDKITEAYFKTIDEKRNIPRPFTDEQAKRWLSIVAIHMCQRRGAVDGNGSPRSDDDDSASQHKGDILAELTAIEGWLLPILTPECADEKAAREMLESFLSYVANRSAFLQPRSEGAYGFVHLSFLEYFAACYLERELRHHSDLTLDRLSAESEGLQFDEAEYLRRNPRGPVAIYPKDLSAWAALDVWHETLVFLMEFHCATAEHPTRDRLLKSLFPALHGPVKPAITRTDAEKITVHDALLPQAAVVLAVKLAGDRQIALQKETRGDWWRRLWTAFLTWPYSPRNRDADKRWNIAIDLLASAGLQPEIMIALVSQAQHLCISTIRLNRCSSLSELAVFRNFQSLRVLSLDGCVGVRDLGPINGLRGLQKLYLDGCTGLSELNALQGLVNLRMLRLVGCSGLNDLTALKGLVNLRSLRLANCTAVSDLSPLGELVNLETLSLDGCTGVGDLAPLRALNSLQELYLNGCTGVGDLTGLESLVRLQTLRFGSCPRVWNLSPLHSLARLQTLFLAGCTGVSDIMPLKHLRSLQLLNLAGCTTVRDLTALKDLRGLRTLDLSGCTGVSDLASLKDLGGLQRLFLEGCTGVSDIMPLKDLRSLQLLNLAGCTSVNDLTALKDLRGLRTLDLSGCTGVSDLASLKDLGSLQRLSLAGCKGVKHRKRQVAELRKALPECQIGG